MYYTTNMLYYTTILPTNEGVVYFAHKSTSFTSNNLNYSNKFDLGISL